MLTQVNCQDFEEIVSACLIRHQSILDLMAKCQETSARTNRAISKAVTTCGCIKIEAQKQPIPPEASLKDIKNIFSNHLKGELCENCREIIIDELGKNLFYTTALCNTLGISIEDILKAETNKAKTLGRFNLT